MCRLQNFTLYIYIGRTGPKNQFLSVNRPVSMWISRTVLMDALIKTLTNYQPKYFAIKLDGLPNTTVRFVIVLKVIVVYKFKLIYTYINYLSNYEMCLLMQVCIKYQKFNFGITIYYPRLMVKSINKKPHKQLFVKQSFYNTILYLYA